MHLTKHIWACGLALIVSMSLSFDAHAATGLNFQAGYTPGMAASVANQDGGALFTGTMARLGFTVRKDKTPVRGSFYAGYDSYINDPDDDPDTYERWLSSNLGVDAAWVPDGVLSFLELDFGLEGKMVRLETIRRDPENRRHRYFGVGFRAGSTFKATAGPIGFGLKFEGHLGSLSSGTDLENDDTVLRDISYDGTAVMLMLMLNH